MRKRSFREFRTCPQQGFAALPAFAPSVREDGRLRVGGVRTVTPTAIRFGDMRPDADCLKVDHRLALIPLVGHAASASAEAGTRGDGHARAGEWPLRRIDSRNHSPNQATAS